MAKAPGKTMQEKLDAQTISWARSKSGLGAREVVKTKIDSEAAEGEAWPVVVSFWITKKRGADPAARVRLSRAGGLNKAQLL